MTLTTNPATVTAGRVRMSLTNPIKRDALIGRAAQHTLFDGRVVIGTITAIVDGYPRMTIHRDASGSYVDQLPLTGRWVRLDSVVRLVDECGTCHYSSPATAGHWPYCPER